MRIFSFKWSVRNDEKYGTNKRKNRMNERKNMKQISKEDKQDEREKKKKKETVNLILFWRNVSEDLESTCEESRSFSVLF